MPTNNTHHYLAVPPLQSSTKRQRKVRCFSVCRQSLPDQCCLVLCQWISIHICILEVEHFNHSCKYSTKYECHRGWEMIQSCYFPDIKCFTIKTWKCEDWRCICPPGCKCGVMYSDGAAQLSVPTDFESLSLSLFLFQLLNITFFWSS